MIVYRGKQEKHARGRLKRFLGYGGENGLLQIDQIPGRQPEHDRQRLRLHGRKTGSGSGLFF